MAAVHWLHGLATWVLVTAHLACRIALQRRLCRRLCCFTLQVVLGGDAKRYCQQCSVFHPLGDFDGDKRYCHDLLPYSICAKLFLVCRQHMYMLWSWSMVMYVALPHTTDMDQHGRRSSDSQDSDRPLVELLEGGVLITALPCHRAGAVVRGCRGTTTSGARRW